MSKGLPRSMSRGSPQRQEIIKQTIQIKSLLMDNIDGASGIGWTTKVIGDLPEGNILFLGAVANLKFTKNTANITATFTGNFSLGTAPTADSTLSAGEVDLIPSTALQAGVSGVSSANRATHAVAVSGTVYDNTDNSLELNLNLIIADAAIDADDQTVTADGTVTLVYCMMLDD